MKHIKKIEEKLIIYLSHRPKLYALIVGIGIVLFWRGVWHTTDFIHLYFNSFQSNFTTDLIFSPWWDGILSLITGSIILSFTGAFTSSFIGNELILSGLRGEKKLNQKTEVEIESEFEAISAIKLSIKDMDNKIDQLERKIREKNNHPK